MGGVDKGVGGGRGAVREVDSVNANETEQQTSGQFNAYLHLTAAGEEKKTRIKCRVRLWNEQIDEQINVKGGGRVLVGKVEMSYNFD